MFRPKGKEMKRKMNFRISGQKVNIVKEAKYLGIILDEHLTFTKHMELLKNKLNRANGLLAKIRYYVSPSLLRTIYFAVFESHLRYGCQIWGQTSNQKRTNLETIQNKSIRIIHFKDPQASSSPIYKESKIMKLHDIIATNNLTLAHDQINKNLPNNFENLFTPKHNQHQHSTRKLNLDVPQVKTQTYGSNSITLCAIREWNKTQNEINNTNLTDLSRAKFIQTVKDHKWKKY